MLNCIYDIFLCQSFLKKYIRTEIFYSLNYNIKIILCVKSVVYCLLDGSNCGMEK